MFVCMPTATQSCLTLCSHIDCGLPAPVSMVFSSKTTGVGCYALLQGMGLKLPLLN